MQYPSFAEYSEALQSGLATALADPLLGRGELRMRGPGQPVAHSGSFALTFEVAVDGKTYAVRCFHKHSNSLHERYRAISEHLRAIDSPYFVNFEFQPSGITTESGRYPVVRMEWAEGETLATVVAHHREDVNALQQLRVSLRRLAAHLRQHGIAHGDIQPGNIIVQGTSGLRLIDYDGMFVPALEPLTSAELGQPNFQHPWRRPWNFEASLDAFSFALIDLALDALCHRPALWDQTGSDADAFILRADDLANPSASPVFRVLASVPGLEQRVRQFAAICASPFDRVPAFEDFLAGRNVPPVSVVFSGDVILPSRRAYASVYDVVDASNFARCCAHVGDCVELVGRVVRVVTSREPEPGPRCLRLEFAEHSHDMVCLKVWPDALASLDAVPDETWVGQWVSAVGLVDPVYSDGDGEHRRKDVSISITDPSQLHRLSEDEARSRLRAQSAPATAALGGSGGVRTDRVDTFAAAPVAEIEVDVETPAVSDLAVSVDAPAPAPSATPAAESGTAPPGVVRKHVPLRVRPWRQWIAAGLLATLAAYAFVAVREAWLRTSSDTVEGASAAGQAGDAARTPMASVRPTWQRADSELESQSKLAPAPFPLQTLAGTLDLAAATTGGQRVLLLDGEPVLGLRDDVIVLAHRSVFSDREIIVGFTQCNGDSVPCSLKQPFWLEVQDSLAPNVWRVPDLWVGADAGPVTTDADGIRVDLGVWNGERRIATLTAAGNIEVTRKRQPVKPLSRADCATVAQAAEACAGSRDCSSFETSAQPIPPKIRARLTRVYHESTGLDAVAFRELCVQSCQFGLTPSRSFIRQHVCNGAPPGQWVANDPAAGPWEITRP